MTPEQMKNTTSPDLWYQTANEMNEELRMLDRAAARRQPSTTLSEREAEQERHRAVEPARLMMQAIGNNQWGGTRLQFTLGQLDTDLLVLLAERRVIDWQSCFNAKAMHGRPQDLVELQQNAVLNGTTVNLQVALSHAAKPQLLIQGLRHEGSFENTEQLFKMGADPLDGNGALFTTVVEQGRSDIGRLFAKYGQNGLLDITPHINAAKGNRKLKLYEDLRKIQWDFGRFSALDRETLMEVKTLPDNIGAIKIIFNFASQRVSEIFETTNPRQSTMKDYTFDEYGTAALEAARAKLIDLGGQPSDIELPLRGKAPIAKPATLGGSKP